MRAILRVLLAVFLVLVIGWLGIWWFAETRMQAGLQAWADRLSAQPALKITYDSISRGTSPLAATATLTNVQFIFQPDPNAAAASVILPSLTLAINAADPLDLNIDLPNRIAVNTPRADLAVSFGAIAASERLDLAAVLAHRINPFKASSVQASNISFLASSGSLLVLQIDGFTANGNYNRNAGASDTAISAAESIKGIALSPLLTRLASIPFGGKLTELAFNLNISGPLPPDLQGLYAQLNALPLADRADRRKISLGAVHDWAAQGGHADGGLTLVLGPTTLNAAGNVKFDANAQPSGAATVTANHLDALDAAITGAYPATQNYFATAQAKLSPYLSSTADGGQTLSINVSYGNGSATVNGQTSPLPPVNWTLLENPPAQAPGDGSGAATP